MATNKGDVSRIILVDKDEEYNIKDEDILKIIKDKNSYPKEIEDQTSGSKKTFDTLEKELEFVRKKVISDSELAINYSDSIQEEGKTEDSLYSRKINGVKQPQMVGFWNSLDGNVFRSGIQSITHIDKGVYRVTLDSFNIFNRKFDGKGDDSFKVDNDYIVQGSTNNDVKIIQTFFDEILSNKIFKDERLLNKDIYNSENLIEYWKECVDNHLKTQEGVTKFGDIIIQSKKGYFILHMLEEILKSIGLSDCISFIPASSVPASSTDDFNIDNLLYYINSNKFFITCDVVDSGGFAKIPTLIGIKTTSNSTLKYAENSYNRHDGTYHCRVGGKDACTVNVFVSEIYIRVTDNNADEFSKDVIFKNLTVWYCDGATKG